MSPLHGRRIWRTSAHYRLRSVGEFGAPLQISTGFASWQRYCTALQYWALAKLCGVEQRAPPVFGRAAITLAHVSSLFFSVRLRIKRTISYVYGKLKYL